METNPTHCTITITLRRFSSCDAKDSVPAEYKWDNHRFKNDFRVRSYANGSCPENKEHVSIIFNRIRPIRGILPRTVAFSCIASVIDASGSSRFPQSIGQSSGGGLIFVFGNFGFERYLRRSTLLDDPDELLPDDCLTIRLEIDFEITQRETPSMFSRFELHVENDGCYLDTNTEFFRVLSRLSPVFQAMTESPMSERETGRIRFPLEIRRALFLIYSFLTGPNFIVSLPDIYKLYKFAHMYDMQPIIYLCHELLVDLMRAMDTQEILDYVSEDVQMISELVYLFEDEVLQSILESYSNIQKKIKDGTLVLGSFKPI